MFNKTTMTNKEIETIIGPSVVVEGNFIGHGNVVVDGSVVGMLKTEGSVQIGKDAKIKADVEGTVVIIAGDIRGNVKATERLQLLPTARIHGNVQTPNLAIESGALFHGKSIMEKNAEEEARQQDKNKHAAPRVKLA